MKFISQGTYGCVYSSNTNYKSCRNRKEANQTISKIQIMRNIDNKKIFLVKRIQTIFPYESFFAPILETYPIDIGRIEHKEKKKCQIFQVGTKQYVTSKIRYVGKNTINYLI